MVLCVFKPQAMGGAEDPATIQFATEKFQELKAGGASGSSSGALDADLRGLVYSIAAAQGGVEVKIYV